MMKNTFPLISILALLATPLFAGWFQDRDNSMSDAHDAAGDAMAVIYGHVGQATQAIQVCPGVYLAAAHGALVSPIKYPQLEGREPSTRVIHYPMSPENMIRTTGYDYFSSPRIHNDSLWERGHEETDYVFIRVDDPVRPDAFVPILHATPADLMRYAGHSDRIDIHLYRGKSRYAGAETGTLDFSEENAVPETAAGLRPLYQVPQRVDEECALSGPAAYNADLLGSNCPTEQNVSGSSYITQIGNQLYLAGVHISSAGNYNIESTDRGGRARMITSSTFCADYEQVCGTPCAQLEDVLRDKK